MNKANLKNYAPKARLAFIKAVTERANVLGISAAGTAPARLRGDVAIIDGREWPAKVAGQRDELIARIKRHGFEQTMDEVAYTWFNRFAALRYMELHDYLDHGWRVLSSRDGGLPELLRHASKVTLPGLNAVRAREMQLAGNQDNELYKLLLVAQCNELSRVMPFLFERIDDDTELLLPENLLRTDSIVAKLVESVPEEDWQEIEVIGWLYQFYISEKKEQVIGKVVKSEDIPAATQLFTPNWIVQYLVQNSVGRLWLMANPTSTLASQWPYYIQPAEQTPEVQAQLDALIQTRIREDRETLNPETITVLDPACGSGHILVVAYDVLKAIYLERGYQLRSIPRLILEKNLHGLDIDERAAQLAGFALLMKARADDRRLFGNPPKLNLLCLQDSEALNVDELTAHLAPLGVRRTEIKSLVETFAHAKTFGSLIRIPAFIDQQLLGLTTGLQRALGEGDLYAQQAARDLLPLVWQATLLAMHFDAVVANPPYMGGKYMNELMKKFIGRQYPRAKADLFACFIERGAEIAKDSGFFSSVTMDAWMFLSSYAQFRAALLGHKGITSLIHVGWNCFPEGHTYNRGVLTVIGANIPSQTAQYINLSDVPATTEKGELFLSRCLSGIGVYKRDQRTFDSIPDRPIAYWVSESIRAAFNAPSLGQIAELRAGITTGDNDRFVRHWSEISARSLSVGARSANEFWRNPRNRWAPLKSGGDFRKWSGNLEKVIRYDEPAYRQLKAVGNHCASEERYFLPSLTWSDIGSTKQFGVRYAPAGCVFSTVGHSLFCDDSLVPVIAAFLCSAVASHLIMLINPTIHANPGDVAKLPLIYNDEVVAAASRIYSECESTTRQDWDDYERSWGFARHPLLNVREPSGERSISLAEAFKHWTAVGETRTSRMQELERENNTLFATAFGVVDEFVLDVPREQITLKCNPSYRYGAKAEDSSLQQRYREELAQELVSFVIGCMLGRYSLDEPGLIYAHAGNIDFEPGRYERNFSADADGILPLTDEPWFEDDAASRVREFLRAAWGANTLEENMVWLAESLGTKGGETTDEAIRRYLADKFFKDHLQTYKKRPIYWLFSSGKQGAFQALVYLHRYNQGTLARMRAEYVVPMIAKMASRLDMLDKDVAAASSAAARTKLQKQIESLRKKQIELLAYDEKLRHYADMRITLDLDDGVKVNYAKFGDLVAESKAITGGSDE